MIILSLSGLLSLLVFGYGACLLFIKQSDFYERIIFSAAFGTGTAGLLIFLLNGALGLPINFASSLLLCLFLLVIGSLLVFYNRKNIEWPGKIRKNELLKKNLVLKIILAIMIILILYKSLFFPIVNGDAIGFQAPLVKDIYNEQGLPLDVGPNTVESTRAYPLFFHLIAAWLINLNQGFNDIFIRMLPPLFSLLSLLVTYLLAKKFVFQKARPALLSAFLVMSLPMFVNFSVYANQETMFTFFSLSGVYFIMKYLQEKNTKDKKDMLFGFMFLAFSIHTKQLGLFYSLSVFVALVFILFGKELLQSIKSKHFIKGLKHIINSREFKALCLSVLLFLVIIAPYFIRNMVEFNDPLYPFLSASSLHLNGKNFVPFIYQHITEAYAKVTLFHSPAYTLFGIVNYVREKAYCMSVFLAVLVLVALFRFKKLKQEQRYLLYFMIIFTAYYAYSFLLKYRYYMAAVPLVCIVAAGELDRLIGKGAGKKTRIILWISLISLAIALAAYFAVLAKKEFVVGLLGASGPLAEHFLAMPDLVVIMNLIVPMIALLLFLLCDNGKAWKICVAMIMIVLSIPSLYSLAFIQYGITSDTFVEGFGWIRQDKDLGLFQREVLKPLPDKEAVLKLNLGEYYDVIQFINKLPKDSAILSTENGGSYYIDKPMIIIDSYKMASTYSVGTNAWISMAGALEALKNNSITHVLYKNPGWDESVFGYGDLISKSVVVQNLHNNTFFKPVFKNKQYTIYEVVYSR